MPTKRRTPLKTKAAPKREGSTRGATDRADARKVVSPSVQGTSPSPGSTAAKAGPRTPLRSVPVPPSHVPNASGTTYFTYDESGHMTPVDSLGQLVGFTRDGTYTDVPLAHQVTYFNFNDNHRRVASSLERRDAALEIEVIGGRRVRVLGDVDAALLTKVVTVLEGLAR